MQQSASYTQEATGNTQHTIINKQQAANNKQQQKNNNNNEAADDDDHDHDDENNIDNDNFGTADPEPGTGTWNPRRNPEGLGTRNPRPPEPGKRERSTRGLTTKVPRSPFLFSLSRFCVLFDAIQERCLNGLAYAKPRTERTGSHVLKANVRQAAFTKRKDTAQRKANGTTREPEMQSGPGAMHLSFTL